jgi:hypothetical protein
VQGFKRLLVLEEEFCRDAGIEIKIEEAYKEL